jgi:hypothetical protein
MARQAVVTLRSRAMTTCQLFSAIWLRGLTIAAALFIILFDSTPAHAEMLRCASHRLVPAELDHVFGLARSFVPRGGGSLRLDSVCSNRDFAMAWFRTSTVLDPDGVHWWWSERCERRARSWSCDPAIRERRIEVTVEDSGQRVTVVGSLPDGMSVKRAQAVIAASATFAMKPEMPLPGCSGSSADATRWHSLIPATPDWDYPEAQVTSDGKGTTVDYDDSISFDFDTEDRAVCWAELVVVT